MADELIDVSPEWAQRAYVDEAKYKAMYAASITDPDTFWGEHGKRLDWIKPYSPARCATSTTPAMSASAGSRTAC